MSDGGVCRIAPATPGLLTTLCGLTAMFIACDTQASPLFVNDVNWTPNTNSSSNSSNRKIKNLAMFIQSIMTSVRHKDRVPMNL